MHVFRWIAPVGAAIVVAFSTLVMSESSPAETVDAAQPTAAIRAGDVAVTGFSGTVLASDKLPPGVDPLDRTFIDVSAPSLRIFDASSLSGALAGQLVNAPLRLAVPAKDIGQVFALAIDPSDNGGPPRIFAAATSAFGLRIVGAGRAADGHPNRLKAGTPDATFMEGQFGSLSSNSPGAIYKIDGATGAVSLLADTAFSGIPNTGPGIGGLAYDSKTRTLYASDLDTGLIHRFSLEYNAADLGQYDHGVTGLRAAGKEAVSDDGKRLEIMSDAFKADDPTTWGFTQTARRIDALAVHDGRLYYAVAEGPEIWSIGLSGGAFLSDPRLEVALNAAKPFPVTSIAFDATGQMLLAQRSPVQNPYDYGGFTEPGAQVLRYVPETPDDPSTPGLWSKDPAIYAIGTADDSNAGSGGVSLQYGYKPDGFLDLNTCSATVAATGDTLAGIASGVQFNALELVRPANVPPTQSAFIDYSTGQDEPTIRGHVGNVAAVLLCGVDAGFPPIAEGGPPVEGGGAFPPVAEGGIAGGGIAGGGGTFPPVDDGGAGGETFPPVEGGGGTTDPNAANLAPTKTQTCKLVAADKAECEYLINLANTSQVPFVANDVIFEDRFSVAPQSFDIGFSANKTATGFTTEPNTFGATTIPPGPQNFSNQIKATFAVPPGGLTVENCITVKPGKGGEPARPDFKGAETQTPLPDLPASTTNGLDRAIAITGEPKCRQRGDLRDCKWIVTISNPGTAPSGASFSVTTSIPNVGMGSSAGVATSSEGSTTFFSTSVGLPPKRQMRFEVSGTFPAEPATPITATASVASQNIADVNPANNTAQAAAGTDAAEVVASNGVTTEDANPDDNTSCIAWNSNTPDDQGTPTNEPTLPPPVVDEQPEPSKAGQLALLKTGVACQAKKACTFMFAIKNTSANDFDGDVEFDDFITGDGAIFGATAITPAPAAPWSCAKNGQGFKCAAKLKIAANGAAPPLSLMFDLGPGIGAVKEVKNCATLKGAAAASCATLPLEPEPNPAGGQPKLTITKTGPAECSDLGGCNFTIAIKNEGDAPFNGPVVVNEELTLDGKAAPEAVLVPNQTWTCTPGGNSTCTSIPAMIIGPQGTATLRLRTVFSKPTGAKVMQNCASVVGAAAKSCVSVNLLEGPKLVLRKERVDGVCDPTCTFRITATNVGNQTIKGPIKIVDFPRNIKNDFGLTDIKAEVVSATMVASVAKVSCNKPGNIWCDINSDLPPGVSTTFDLTTTVGLMEFTGENCVLPRDQIAGKVPAVCTAMSGQRAAGPNLAIEKRNFGTSKQGVDHCELKGECLFIIRVTNTGKSDFVGPIKINDTISLGAPELLQEGPGGNVGWNCTKAGAGGIGAASIDCTIPGAPNPLKPGTFVPLAPGKFIELGISVKPGKSWKDSNILKNCAELVDAPPNMGPIKSCASQKLDPFKVKVTKTGDQSCQPGSQCRFELDIFNDEQIVHDDPVTVTDKLSGLSSAQIVSITPAAGADPFPCTPAPTHVPFTCTGHMNLTPGEHNKYVMIVRLPADANATAFSNCATVGSTDTSGAASEPACHSVQLAPPDQPFSLKIDKTGPATCAPGSECAFNLTLTNTGRAEHKGAVTLTDGLSGIDSMPIVSTAPSLPCTQQPQAIPFNCRTNDDFTVPAGASRKFSITARVPRSADTFTNCAFVAGGKASARDAGQPSSSCVTVRSPEKAEPTKPECKGGMILTDDGLCACPSGTTWNGRNCITRDPTPPPVCKGARPIGVFPNCCPRGTHFERGACRPDKDNTGKNDGGASGVILPPTVCDGARPIGNWPNCCPRGTHFRRGACRPDKPDDGKPDGGASGVKLPVCEGARPIGNWPNCCPRGTHFRRGACRPDKPDDGKPDGGASGIKLPVCEGARPIGNWPNCCPRGTHFRRGACRPDKPDDAGKDGGGSSGTKPGCPMGMTGTPPNCCPPGTRFQNGTCVKPTIKCPPGTHLSRSGQCVPNAEPTPTPSKAEEPKKARCTGGSRGTPPNCYCVPPSKFLGGRCRYIPNPGPPKNDSDKIIVR
ncbi:DUF11 domain-containing protein [Hyphomicrobium sulfonivorans]|uniref:DUF11 domain-containing protein n=1 Tax=Hyphomicrobium sulfonivorans TaxID=121290 RepID=UPI00156DC268|nr:DUF11 domain-containing protein [Hyphomicrobium sulfonivorans]MBI1649076.1 DUF11 domain-containing protein [Hyphomicrobium sulfonivorans]